MGEKISLDYIQPHLWNVLQNFGTTMRASIKSQINLEVTAVDGIKNAEGLRDMILPLAWMEELSDTLGQV